MPAPARSALLPVAALVSLLVFALVATAAFALSYTNQKSTAALERLDRLHTARVAAVEARVNFKTQVQEWKNILLRGANPTDLTLYRQRFQQEREAVARGLAALPAQLAAAGLDDTAARPLPDQHRALGLAYDRALAGFRPEAPGSAAAVDAEVRGIDRQLNNDLDALAGRLEQASAEELKSFGTAAATRYATLRKVTLGLGAAAMLMALWLVFRAQRAA